MYKDKSGKSLKDIAYHFGKNRNFFSVMKTMQKEKHAYINSRSPGNILLGYQIYVDEMNLLRRNLEDAIYWIEDNGYTISNFSRFLHEKRVFSSYNTFSSSGPLMVFSLDEGFKSFRGFKQYTEVYEYFKLYKEEKLEQCQAA